MLRGYSRCSLRPTSISVRAPKLAQIRRQLLTLAIETSCDETSVAILEKQHPHPELTGPPCTLYFHEKRTADNRAHAGIHPIVSLQSHQETLSSLIAESLHSLPPCTIPSDNVLHLRNPDKTQAWRQKPDFITVTRGPGMRSSLNTGLDTAKGLAVAWQVPLLGVNHMQAHALTPRLVSALKPLTSPNSSPEPAFSFLTLLVSGGHTLLVHSKNPCNHFILAETSDIAIGDCIDKIARSILPSSFLNQEGEKDTMYGRLLERFVFPPNVNTTDHAYTAPNTRGEEIARKETKWGWSLPYPLAETRSGSKSKSMEFTFSGLGSAVNRIYEASGDAMSEEERRELGRESMRIAFEHLASRTGWALTDMQADGKIVDTLVVSGGVACNNFLRTVLRSFLAVRGFPDLKLVFPPAELCTDNAAMIAWTGMEMFEAGWESDLGCRSLRKWSIDPSAEDGGILGADCWTKRGLGGERSR